MVAKTLLLVLFSIALSGCANLSTISRSTSLPKGKVVHLDAAQRIAFENAEGILCAEPSPDALQAYASSLGAGISKLGAGSVAISNALATSAANIGLRTQSITLMRDHLYRICEASHNKKLTPPDVAQLFRRSQDMTLALLAIEQLTGAVVAKQVILNSGANATATGNVTDTQARLEQARNYEQAKKLALERAQAARDEQKKIVDDLSSAPAPLPTPGPPPTEKGQGDSKSDESKPTDSPAEEGAKKENLPAQSSPKVAEKAATNAIEQATPTAPTEKPKDMKKVDGDAQTPLQVEQTKLEQAEEALKQAKSDYSKAQEITQTIVENVDTAISASKATAKGAGAFSEQTLTSNVNAETAATLSEATKTIVQQVLEKGHTLDSCITFINTWSTDAELRKDNSSRTVLEMCVSIIQKWTDYRIAAGKSSAFTVVTTLSAPGFDLLPKTSRLPHAANKVNPNAPAPGIGAIKK